MAGEYGTGYILSTISAHRLEDVKAATMGPTWYQLYLLGGRGAAEGALERARKAGFSALVISSRAAMGHPDVANKTPFAFEVLYVVDEEQLLARLNRGVDGVIIEYDGRRATFLPQVWATLPEPRDFIVELKRKAGMADDFWSAAVNVFRYSVTKWKESELAAARDTV